MLCGRWIAGSLLAAATAGCLWEDPFLEASRRVPELNPATTEVAIRVDTAGREILLANPDLPVRPLFHTIGMPEATLFHRGVGELFISEGLVRQCDTDAKLKAVLCAELGQMETERQVSEAEDWRGGGESLPLRSGIPVSVAGAGEEPDFTRTAELARFESKERGRRVAEARPDDPRLLAGQFLSKSGHDPAELQAVEPLIRQARLNRKMEYQFTRPDWTRP